MTGNQDFGAHQSAGDGALGGYQTGGYPPGGYVPPPAGSDALHSAVLPGAEPTPSTTDVAKDQAANVAGGAAEAAQQVAGVAKEQVGQVAAEATRQVKDLLGQAQSELTGQAQVQQEKLAGGLHAVGDQLKSMAQGSDQPGMATDLAHQAAGKAHDIASWLENRDPGSVLDEVRSYARQRPGTFLAIALGAGVVAGRLARGLAADPGDTGQDRKSAPAPAGSAGRPVGYLAQPTALPGGPTALDLPAGVTSDVYGTGQVPDWTGKPVADTLSDAR